MSKDKLIFESDDILRKIEGLSELADSFGRKIKGKTLGRMADALDCMDADRFDAVVDHAFKTCEYMPTVAKLIEIHETIKYPERSAKCRQVEKWLIDNSWNPGSGSIPQDEIDKALESFGHQPGDVVYRNLWSS